jgi:AcrR family transcriptional regulator
VRQTRQEARLRPPETVEGYSLRDPKRATTEAAHGGAPAPDVKERIRAAALRLFAERGFHAVSVRHICTLAETTLPMVYYYYGSKKGLHDSLLEEAVERRLRRLRLAKRVDGELDGRLRAILVAWALPDEALPGEVQLFYVRELTGVGVSLNTRLLNRLDRELRGALKAVLDEGIAAGELRPVDTSPVVLAMIGIVNTFRRRIVLGAGVTLADGIQQATETFLEGLRTRAGGGPGASLAARSC